MTIGRNITKAMPRLRSSVRPRSSVAKAACQLLTPSTSMTRGQSTSTMDLVYMDEIDGRHSSLIFSTLQYVAERDVVVHAPPQKNLPRDPMEAALRQHPNPLIAAEELDLVQAAERRQLYDKVLLLVQHGEEATHDNEEGDDPESLSAKGVGQALSLSRRMAAFCNTDTELVPDLYVMAPLKKVLQTAFLAFPYETPHHSINNVKWVCHPQTLDWTNPASVLAVPETARDLQRLYAGVDYSLMAKGSPTSSSVLSREARLLEQADTLLEWLKTRDERVVVLSGEASALNAFSCRLHNQLGSLPTAFEGGELRAFGLHYTK